MKAIRHHGMPSQRFHEPGTLYIQFDIEFPPSNWVDKQVIMSLEKILPSRPELDIPPDAMIEDVELTTMNDDEQRRSASNHMANGEDEDEGHGPSVQCAQQ